MSQFSMFFQINLNIRIYKFKIFPVALYRWDTQFLVQMGHTVSCTDGTHSFLYRWDTQFLVQLKRNGLHVENNEVNICTNGRIRN